MRNLCHLGAGDDYSIIGDIFNTALSIGNAVAPIVNIADSILSF
jgi:hypothetical protein